MQTAQDAARAESKAFGTVVDLARALHNACRWSHAEDATVAFEEADPGTDTAAVPRVLEFGLYTTSQLRAIDTSHLQELVRTRYGDAPWKAARICRSFYSDTAAVVVAEFLTALPSDAHHEAWSDLFLCWWENGDNDQIGTPEHSSMLKKWLSFDWGRAAANILAQASDPGVQTKGRKSLFASLVKDVPRKFYGVRLTEPQKKELETNKEFRVPGRGAEYLRGL